MVCSPARTSELIENQAHIVRMRRHPWAPFASPPSRESAYALSTNAPDPLIRSDIVYFETAKGGAVFSVGSIAFCESLPWNNFDNQISVPLQNVVERFMAN
jgi:hypothetical protein